MTNRTNRLRELIHRLELDQSPAAWLLAAEVRARIAELECGPELDDEALHLIANARLDDVAA